MANNHSEGIEMDTGTDLVYYMSIRQQVKARNRINRLKRAAEGLRDRETLEDVNRQIEELQIALAEQYKRDNA